MTRFRYSIALEGPAIGTGGHRMGFTPRESDHAKCGGVYISSNPIVPSAVEFISSTLNIGVKKSKSNRHRIRYKKSNRYRMERTKPQPSHH